MEKELLCKIKYLLNKKKSIDYICNTLDITNNELFHFVNALNIDIDIKEEVLEAIKEPYILDINKEHIKLLLMGDTHLCNKNDRLDIIRYLYYKAEDTNTDLILHSGDFTDGYPLIDGYEKILKEKTFNGQKEYVISEYPMYSNKTLLISGNHDEYWFKKCGRDILKEITDIRKDITYLGNNRRDIIIGNINIKLMHGNPNSYLGSKFKPIRFIKELDKKPNILHTGHLHCSYNDKIDNTYYFRNASLMNKTPYTESRGYKSEKSVYWIDLYLDDNKEVEKVKYKRELFH